MSYKLGRQPAIHNLTTMRRAIAMARVLDTLGDPPPHPMNYCDAVDVAVGGDNNWGMMGNNSIGDCTFADSAHQIMIHTANVGKIFIPTDSEVIAAYSACTGYNPANPASDQGAAEVTVCDFMIKYGLAGQKSEATAPIDPINTKHLMWGVQLFGAVRIGLTLPASAETQFNNNQPWDVVPGSQILGGHDVCITYYETMANGTPMWYICSWGRGRQPMTDAFRNLYVEEAHGELYMDWLTTWGISPSGFNTKQLLSDLTAISN